MQKGSVLLWILVVIIVAGATGFGVYYLTKFHKSPDNIEVNNPQTPLPSASPYSKVSNTHPSNPDITNWKSYNLGTVLNFKAPPDYYVKFGGTSGKDVVLIADKESSTQSMNENYVVIDANGTSGYEPYSNYDSSIRIILRDTNREINVIDQQPNSLKITSKPGKEFNGEKIVYGVLEFLKYKEAGIRIQFLNEEITNPHMYDKIISTIKLNN